MRAAGLGEGAGTAGFNPVALVISQTCRSRPPPATPPPQDEGSGFDEG